MRSADLTSVRRLRSFFVRRRTVLGQPPPEIARLADVEQSARGVVHAIDARLARNCREKVGAELPFEDPHAPLSQRACRSTKHLTKGGAQRTDVNRWRIASGRRALRHRRRSPLATLPTASCRSA